jgi:hypothetical protein
MISPSGGAVRSPARVVVSQPNPLASVFYTLDGSDPRTVFGEVAPTARPAATAVSINRPVVLRARVRLGDEWSPLATAAFTVDQDFSTLLISELMYHPRGSGDDSEFIEFANVGRDTLDLGGLILRTGSDEAWLEEHFRFQPRTRLDPAAFLVLVRNQAAYHAIHPDGPVDGVTTARLSNSDSQLRLESAERALAMGAYYATAAPWQVVPDNHGYFPDDSVGFSLVRRTLDPGRDPEHHSSWRASSHRYGSPGRDDPPSTVPAVFINELMTRGNAATPDFVEFYNPNDQPVDLGGWWLSDERNFPFRYSIPVGTVVPARGHLVLDESQFGSGVSFSGEGERCYLFSAAATGALTGYSHGFQFSGSARGVSFARHLASDGSESFPVHSVPTPGTPNAGPTLPPVVITEIGFRSDQARTPFIELYNRTHSDITLNSPDDPQATWALGSGPHFPISLPPGLVIRSHQCLVLVREDPDEFRQFHAVPADVPVVAAQDILLNLRPEVPLFLFEPAGRAADQIRRMAVEQIDWRPVAPWPAGADTADRSLQRINPDRFANDPANWRTGPGLASPGKPNPGNLPPRVWAGGTQTGFTGRAFTLAGQVSDDAWDGAPPTMAWAQTSGPAAATIDTPAATTTRIHWPRTGTYHLRLQASDGTSSVEDTTMVEVRDGAFEGWVLAHFPAVPPGPEHASLPLSDPDGDGATNLEEYIFDTPPRQANGGSAPEVRVVNGRWEIAWKQRLPEEDYEVTVESATHPAGPWLADEAFYERAESPEGGLTRVVASEKFPVPGRDRAYVRLRCRLR